MMHNFVACFWKGGDFLNLIQFAFIHGRTVKGAESNIFTSKPRSVFKTLGLIRFEVVFYHTRTTKAENSKGFTCKLRDNTTYSKGLIT